MESVPWILVNGRTGENQLFFKYLWVWDGDMKENIEKVELVIIATDLKKVWGEIQPFERIEEIWKKNDPNFLFSETTRKKKLDPILRGGTFSFRGEEKNVDHEVTIGSNQLDLKLKWKIINYGAEKPMEYLFLLKIMENSSQIILDQVITLLMNTTNILHQQKGDVEKQYHSGIEPIFNTKLYCDEYLKLPFSNQYRLNLDLKSAKERKSKTGTDYYQIDGIIRKFDAKVPEINPVPSARAVLNSRNNMVAPPPSEYSGSKVSKVSKIEEEEEEEEDQRSILQNSQKRNGSILGKRKNREKRGHKINCYSKKKRLKLETETRKNVLMFSS